MSKTFGSVLSDFGAFVADGFHMFLAWWRWIYAVIIGFLYASIKFACWGVTKLFVLVGALPGLIDQVQTGANGGEVSGLALFAISMNTFFPLDLILVFMSVLFHLWIWSLCYRFIKSWIPTLS